MRKLVVAAAVALLALVAACGDDDGGTNGTIAPEGPATVTIQKAFARDQAGVFTFTLQIANVGENSAVQIALSDVWEGLTLTSIGDLGGITANPIGDSGFEVLLDELPPGETRDIVYKAECASSGQWTNTAAVSWQPDGSDTTSVSVSCP